MVLKPSPVSRPDDVARSGVEKSSGKYGRKGERANQAGEVRMSHLTDSQIFHLLDGMIDPAERQRVDAHLAQCQQCRQQLELWRAVEQRVKHQPLASTSAQFTPAIMRRVHFHNRQRTSLRFLMQHGLFARYPVTQER
jgi:hypothetical protein